MDVSTFGGVMIKTAEQNKRDMSEQCSATSPHAAHTYNGRPVKFCAGISEMPIHKTTKEDMDAGIIRDPVNGWAIRND